MINLIEPFIKKLSKDDILSFAHKNNLSISEHELDFVYSFIKSNYATVLKNPNSFDIAIYKNEFSNENYLFLKNLIEKYKKMVI